jgi:Ca-activated chloride channel family protein
MTSPALTDIRIELAGVDTNRAYPRDIPDLFDGGQIVWVGRYRQSGTTTIRVTGKVGDERRRFEFPTELASTYRGSGHDYVERLWAVRRVGDLIDQIDLQGQNKELVDELVALSMKYGLLTPYTAFLADERVQLHARADNAALSGRYLEELRELSGESAVVQRRIKQDFMQATRAAAPSAHLYGRAPESAPAAAGTDGSSVLSLSRAGDRQAAAGGAAQAKAGLGGMMGGMAGQRYGRQTGRGAGAIAKAPAHVAVAPESPEAKVRQLGAKTFYFKNKRWVDSSVTPEDDAKAVVVVQFTDEYFRLARTQKAEYNQYFSQGEPITVKLDGKVYRIDPAP